jgi:ABC-type polysaccharide/polyol phosphate transport system ATPase subunit
MRLRGASRRFRVVHDHSATLKETLIRRSRARYSELWALRDVDLDIAPGESVGIVGRNGSGKSTLLKMLAGILPPQTGVVQAGGSVAAMLELGAGFHPDFTGRENVFMNAAIHGLSNRQVRERFDDIVAFAEIIDFIDMPVRTYSSGMQLRLAFAVAAHVDPDILLLDEVLAVGDEAFQRKCMGRIFDFRRRGGTLVFVSHDPNAVEQVCDRAVLVDGGQIILDGTPQDVMARYHRLLAETTDGVGARITAPAEDPAKTDEGQDAAQEPPAPSELGGWGSGEIAITDVQLLRGGDVVSSVVSGDEMAVRVRLNARETIENPIIGISILGDDGTALFGTNTEMDHFNVGAIDGHAEVTYVIPAVPLHAGGFAVTVAVHSEDVRTMYHWIDRAVAFTVFPRRSGVGLVEVDGYWALPVNR